MLQVSSYPGNEQRKTTPLHDRVQSVLALADPSDLAKFILRCQPSFFPEGMPTPSFSDINVELEKLWDSRRQTYVDAFISFRGVVEGDYETPLYRHSMNSAYYDEGKTSFFGRFVVEIKTEIQSLGEVLRQINKYKDGGDIPVVLVCGELTTDEIKVFQRQGIRIYIPDPFDNIPEDLAADFRDAINLIDLADNPFAIQAVKEALGCFSQAEKRELWNLLTPSQKSKLKA